MHVHLITARNRARYLPEIEEMHRQRHHILVRERGLRAFESADGLDLDEFDTADALYLLAIENATLAGSCRLIPTLKPNTLALYPQFLTADLPQGPNTWEWSRCAIRRESEGVNSPCLQTRLTLSIAGHEVAHLLNITSLVGLAETQTLHQLAEDGWRPERLGPPRSFAGAEFVAVRFEFRTEHLEILRQRTGRFAPVLAHQSLMHADPSRPSRPAASSHGAWS